MSLRRKPQRGTTPRTTAYPAHDYSSCILAKKIERPAVLSRSHPISRSYSPAPRSNGVRLRGPSHQQSAFECGRNKSVDGHALTEGRGGRQNICSRSSSSGGRGICCRIRRTPSRSADRSKNQSVNIQKEREGDHLKETKLIHRKKRAPIHHEVKLLLRKVKASEEILLQDAEMNRC